MICLASVAVVGLAACRIDEPNPLALPAAATAQEAVNENRIHLHYLCGNRFQARNSNRAVVQVTWRVQGTADSGSLTLPARAEHEPYTVIQFTTNAMGTTELYYQGNLVESEANKANACPADNTVPATAPDLIPKALFDSLGVILEAAPPHRRYLKNILVIAFEPHATQAQRQTIIDSLGGRVVGGRGAHRTGSSEGWYYVLIPGDGTTRPADRAAYILNGMPLIGVAFPYRLDVSAPSYRKPRDAVGRYDAWHVDRRFADGDNWALEAVDAALAWGCEVGDPQLKVAVVDDGIYAGITDLAGNLDPQNSSVVLPPAEPRGQHGTTVASVLAALGNNGTQITGMMWYAALGLRDIYTDTTAGQLPDPLQWTAGSDALIVEHLVKAGTLAHVVNLSYGPLHPSPPVAGDSAAEERAREWREIIIETVRRLQSLSRSPLIVLAAGNLGVDAYWSGTAQARDTFPGNIIVVGGMTRARVRADSSNHGPLVDVYAPGEDVGVIDRLGNFNRASGTSYAAPLVAGVAGLLKSFDPRAHMTSAEMKRLILAGAVDSLLEPNGTKKPILNAYGALRKAAEAPGAPLCGSQRVYADYTTGQVRVERVRGNPLSDEALGTMDPFSLDVIFARHGGKTVQPGIHGESPSLVWSASGWTSGTSAPNDGGTVSQFHGGSHDGDSSVVFVFDPSTNQVAFRFWMPGDAFVDLLKPYQFRITPCGPGICVGGGSQFISPVSQRAFIAYGKWQQSGVAESVIETYDLAAQPRPDSTTLLRSYPGKLIFNITMAEDGSELRVRLWVPPGDVCQYEFISMVPPDSGQVRRSITGFAPPPLGGVLCRDDATWSPRTAPGKRLTTHNALLDWLQRSSRPSASLRSR